MKFRYLFLILLLAVIKPISAQYVEFTHLHEFENLSINKMLINNNGNLVVAGSKWDGATNFYFGIYDTSNYQVLADTVHSRWDCMNPHNVFYDVVNHPDSGYLVCGLISQCGSNQPIIYWFNDQAQLIGEYNGSYWGNVNDGVNPIFENLVVRSDSHILATYRYTSMAPSTNSVISTVVMEFNQNLSLINSDTLSRSHTLRMQYVADEEKLVFYGEKFYANTPYVPHPYYCIVDAFTFQKEKEFAFFNEDGYANGIVLKNRVLYFSFRTSDQFSQQKLYSFDIVANRFVDSLIFQQDSLGFIASSSSNLFEFGDDIVSFGAIYDYHLNNNDFRVNHIRVIGSDLRVKKDVVVEESEEESAIGNALKVDSAFYFSYKIKNSLHPSILVLKQALIGIDITSVGKKLKKEKWKIYPNPTSGALRLIIPFEYQKEPLHYRLYNLTGNLIEIKKMGSNALNITNLPKGMYFLTISNKNKVLYTSKISKF